MSQVKLTSLAKSLGFSGLGEGQKVMTSALVTVNLTTAMMVNSMTRDVTKEGGRVEVKGD